MLAQLPPELVSETDCVSHGLQLSDIQSVLQAMAGMVSLLSERQQLPRMPMPRPIQHLAGGAGFDETAFVEDQYALGE